MCEADKDGVSTIVFPTTGTPVTMDNIQSVPADHWVHSLPVCTEAATVRTSIVGNSVRKRRDVSLCDVLSGGGDFVYLPVEDTLFFRATPIPFQVFAFISILTVYLAVILAHNMEVMLGSKKERSSILITELVVVVQIVLLLFASGVPRSNSWDLFSGVLDVFVTTEDRYVSVYLIVYSAYYVVQSLCVAYVAKNNAVKIGAQTPVNPIITTLTMVAMRVHYTLDNTYTVVATVLIATRLLNKIAQLGRTDTQYPAKRLSMTVDILADSVLVALLIYAGVVPHHGREPIITGLYMVQVSSTD